MWSAAARVAFCWSLCCPLELNTEHMGRLMMLDSAGQVVDHDVLGCDLVVCPQYDENTENREHQNKIERDGNGAAALLLLLLLLLVT